MPTRGHAGFAGVPVCSARIAVTLPAMSENDREHLVDTDPEVLEGEDEIPRQPAPPLDPYTPEPGPRPGEQRAFNLMRWAWVPLLIAALVILIALLR
jgi:hypothetical protein